MITFNIKTTYFSANWLQVSFHLHPLQGQQQDSVHVHEQRIGVRVTVITKII